MSNAAHFSRKLVFDMHHFARKVMATMADDGEQKPLKWLLQQCEIGLLPTTQDEQARFIRRLANTLELPLKKEWLAMPHPARYLEVDSLYSGFLSFSKAGMGEIVRLIFSGFMIHDLEVFLLMVAHKAELRKEYPEIARTVDDLGAGGVYVMLLPLIHYVRNDATFTFTAETAIEIEELDIAKGIDSSYIRSPFENCYFHLPKSEHKVHSTQTGMHELEGFYLSESQDHSFDIASDTLAKLGIDSTKPYRYLNLTFVGRPKDHIGNDELAKIDIFLQEGVAIDVLIENMIKWYRGELESEILSGDIENIGSLKNETQIHNFDLDLENNVNLIRVAVNYLAYLNFANYRKDVHDPRQKILDALNGKSTENKKKAAKKLKGKNDVIIVTTQSNVVGSASVSSGDSKHTKSSHIRRGFVRNQHYGSANDRKHRPVYIAPTLIGSGADNKPKKYTVK